MKIRYICLALREKREVKKGVLGGKGGPGRHSAHLERKRNQGGKSAFILFYPGGKNLLPFPKKRAISTILGGDRSARRLLKNQQKNRSKGRISSFIQRKGNPQR